MNKILPKSNILLFFVFFYTGTFAQCSITSTTNASAITCTGSPKTSSLGTSCGGILYIGDGINAMSLNMNADLDLTCLGAIQFIIRNKATLDFDAGSNKNLMLAAGSSIQFETGSVLKSVNNCGASDRILIGGVAVASCNGGSAPLKFVELYNQGYSPITVSASPSTICNSGSSTLTATANPSTGATYKWYTVASGGVAIQSSSSNTFSTGTISATTTYYVEAYYASASPTFTTVRKPITVTVIPPYSLTSVSVPTAQCLSSATVTINGTATGLPVGTYSVTYNRSDPSATGLTASMTVNTAGTGSFTATGLTTPDNTGTTITVTNLASGSCSNAITVNNVSNTFVMRGALSPPTLDGTGWASCSNYIVQVLNQSPRVDHYYLDVSTSPTFVTGAYLAGYSNKDLGTTFQHAITGLTPGVTYYYKFRSSNVCGTTGDSSTGTFVAPPAVIPTPTIGTITQPTCSIPTGSFTISNYVSWYNYTFSPSTGISRSGSTVTASPGNYTITADNGGCVSSPMSFTINAPLSSPTIGSITQPTCSTSTGSFTIGNYNSSYTYTFSPSVGVSRSGATVTATSGSYTISASLSGCSSSAVSFAIDAQPIIPSITSQSSNNSICLGNDASFTVVTSASNPSYQWQYSTNNAAPWTNTDGLNGVSGHTSNILSLTAPPIGYSGNYFRCIITSGSCPVNSSGSLLTINPAPTLTAASQTIFACNNSPATIKLSGLQFGSTFTVDYTIGGVVQPPISNLTAVAGEASFETPNLTTVAHDGKLLQITGITITSATPSCTKSFAGIAGIDITLKVQSNSGDIFLNGTPIASGSSTTFSELTDVTFSINPINGATGYTWVFPAGWIVPSGPYTNVITVKTGNTSQGGVVHVSANNLCESAITVALTSIAPDKPVPTVVIPVKCTALGSVSFDNLPAISWTLNVIKDGLSSSITGSGNTYTVGSLTAGDYTFTVEDIYGVSAASATVSIIEDAKTWNGSGWFKGVDPTIDPTKNDLVVFAGNYSEPDSVEACSCRVNSGVDVTIASGKVLTVVNDLNIQGTLTFKNGASLIQEDASIVNTNNSNIVYERTSSEVVDFDYVYWSSPVKGQTLEDLSPQSDKYWSWVGDYWLKANGQMEAGTGYIARVPRYTSFQTVKFKGAPNNGTIKAPTQGIHKNNLIGNPYPSAIDAVQFMEDNLSVLEEGSILSFWTHNTDRKLSADGSQYVYNPSDYASFNGVGGTRATTGGPEPDGTIAAGQSFMVGSEIKDFFTFTNDMRLGAEAENSLFFKHAKTKKTAKVEKNRIWLNLTNSDGAFKQLLLGYVAGATNDLDKLYDGATFGNSLIDFYSVINSKKYTIQGRGLPFDEKDEVPLGYKTNVDGTFQINIDKVDGSLVNQAVYLEDKVTNTVHDLKKGSYSFTTAKGEFQDRFVLRYTNTAKLGTGDFDSKGKGVVVSVKNSQIKVNSFDETLSSVKVYDLKGSLLYEKDKLDKNEFTIDHLASSNQFMIVMVQLESGKWISEEIIFHD